MFTKAAFISLFVALAAAAPAVNARQEKFPSFTLKAVNSEGNDPQIDYNTPGARQYMFVINLPTLSDCPVAAGHDCDDTIYSVGILNGPLNVTNTSLKMDVRVPGGQRVYVAPDGKLQYEVQHSNYIPEGSIVDGFMATGDFPNTPGRLTFLGENWLACPAGEAVEGTEAYTVYAYAVFGNYNRLPGCKTIELQTESFQGNNAYEYD